MAATTLAVLDPAMKVIANEPLIHDIHAESQLADLFEQDMQVPITSTTQGRYIERAHIIGLPAGVGARAEDENLPEADDPEFKNSRIYLKTIYGTVEMSGHVMRRVVNDEGAFLNYAGEVFPLFAKRVAHDWDRMLVGYGYAIIGRTTTTPTNVSSGVETIPLNRAFGVTGWTGVWRQLLKGQRVVFASSAAATTIRNAGTDQSAKVISVDRLTGVVTFGMSATLAAAISANDYVLPGDNAGISGVGSVGVTKEPQGLVAAVDDGNILATYLNVPRTGGTAVEEFKALMLDSTDATLGFGGVMSEDLLVYADEEIQQVTGRKPSVLVASFSACRGYWKSQKTDQSFVNPRGNFTGGKGRLEVALNERVVPLRPVRKLPDQIALMLVKETFKKYMLNSFTWDDKTGSIWNRVVTTSGRKDRFYAVGSMECETACDFPQANLRVNNLATIY